MSYRDKEKRPYKGPRNTAMSEALTKIQDVLKIRSADNSTVNIPQGAKEVRQLFTRSVFDIVQDVQAPATAFVIATEKDVNSFWYENLYEDPKASRTDLMRNLYNLVRHVEDTTVGSKAYFGIASIASVDELRRNAARNRLKRDRVILEYIQATGMFIELENVGTAVATFRNRKGDWVKGVQTYVLDRTLSVEEAVAAITARIDEKDERLTVEERQAAHLAELRRQDRIEKEFNQPLRTVITEDGKVLPKNIISNVRRLLKQEKVNHYDVPTFINRLTSYLLSLNTELPGVNISVEDMANNAAEGNMVDVTFPVQGLNVRFYFSFNQEKGHVEHRISTRRIKPAKEVTVERMVEEVSEEVKEVLEGTLKLRIAQALASINATGDEDAPVLALEDRPAEVARLVRDAYLADETVGEGNVGFITPEGPDAPSPTDLFIIQHDLSAVVEVSLFVNELEGIVDYSTVIRPLMVSSMPEAEAEEVETETTEGGDDEPEEVPAKAEETVDALVEQFVVEKPIEQSEKESADEPERDAAVPESTGE
jgi:hypothetical protein|nr:MAG TPA: hypothetical protein [Caudoviricetes sp.]